MDAYRRASGVPIGAFDIFMSGILGDGHEGRELTDDVLLEFYKEFLELGLPEFFRVNEVCSRCGGHLDILEFSSEIYGWHYSERCDECGHQISDGGVPGWVEAESREVTAYGIRDEYGGL
jgi:hypothetical protein